ncbi:hypothetical protein PHYBLDRAFT_61109 [Phycomyces blakesleeanus NRRL 1555(-)]|uniref:Uncharacterized protein n=1 Tax=Phycomyces blakesleeanus (strain ATCC 8743b / DSM 1359 / FGSC 10004 / NBRC 33097 / NRRL 1555) TaxID=763407 RepID=A0A162UAR6_PHYB8|nr:hypothetical protein PHYBLDRAFT_61109 [Phycomyces blakesleeanus NRRL 1555(-)]OAD74842.1 hypothetical protein PHYBLDRAFT_61109 [Phycomyces blakesleeanus NRRL 1555(-)]|eukprot:XP_018292882.1 hypothetical protein PHYBLDRAFT_61109 [Phycomyces blakesleeanus NRRL 1555(-)]
MCKTVSQNIAYGLTVSAILTHLGLSAKNMTIIFARNVINQRILNTILVRWAFQVYMVRSMGKNNGVLNDNEFDICMIAMSVSFKVEFYDMCVVAQKRNLSKSFVLRESGMNCDPEEGHK